MYSESSSSIMRLLLELCTSLSALIHSMASFSVAARSSYVLPSETMKKLLGPPFSFREMEVLSRMLMDPRDDTFSGDSEYESCVPCSTNHRDLNAVLVFPRFSRKPSFRGSFGITSSSALWSGGGGVSR